MPLDQTITERIKQVAIASLTANEVNATHLSIAADAFPAGHVFNLVDTRLTVRTEAALLFVDRNPSANWGHECTYRFFDPGTGRFLYEEDALFPPNLAGETALNLFHAPAIASATAAHLLIVPGSRPSPFGAPPLANGEQRYAVLWTSQVSNRRHVEDLEFMWRTLVHVCGFTPGNIYVLCYNGTIGATDVVGPIGNWVGDNTPYQMRVSAAASLGNLQGVFSTLSGKLASADMLLIHTNNHGSPAGCCVDSTSVVTPTQFGNLIAALPRYDKLIVTMEQCFSGASSALRYKEAQRRTQSSPQRCPQTRSRPGPRISIRGRWT